jgi:hypothetical protein
MFNKVIKKGDYMTCMERLSDTIGVGYYQGSARWSPQQ